MIPPHSRRRPITFPPSSARFAIHAAVELDNVRLRRSTYEFSALKQLLASIAEMLKDELMFERYRLAWSHAFRATNRAIPASTAHFMTAVRNIEEALHEMSGLTSMPSDDRLPHLNDMRDLCRELFRGLAAHNSVPAIHYLVA